MYDRVSTKKLAKEQIKGNIGILFVISLIIGLVCGGIGLIPFVGGLIVFFITPLTTMAYAFIYLKVSKTEKPQVEDILSGKNVYGTSLALTILIGIFTFLWMLLLIVPGIIKSLSYSMSYYILAENPDMTALEALNESKRIMNGHKADLFVLELSFILWGLLCCITFGIAGIYVVPYQTTSIVNFYHAIKNESIENVVQ